jgi:predicted  nucleic acid-binding Zn-ribbon protein
VNLLRNWIENWLFGNRLREVEGQVMYANDHADELRERCADIETDYATDQALSDLSEKVDDLESELEEFKRRARVAEKMILEQKKQIEIMDKLLADHINRHNNYVN